MINQDRFIHRFKELVSIPNSSKEEAAMCDYLKKALTELSIPFEEDDTASKINGNCGNLYAYVEGEKALPPDPFICSYGFGRACQKEKLHLSSRWYDHFRWNDRFRCR